MNHQPLILHTLRRNSPLVLLSCLVLGLTGCHWVKLVSVSTTGLQGNELSTAPSISADGRYVAFVSSSSNFAANDTLFANDVFVRDTLAGTTTRISVDNAGNEVYGNSSFPSISGDGRYIAFISDASNLVAGDTNGKLDTFVYDRNTATSTRISVDSAGNEGNGHSGAPAISGDGRYIAFVSEATNFTTGDTNDRSDVFVHDRVTATTTRVSVDSAGNPGNGGISGSSRPAISSDGRYIAFLSTSSNLVPGGTSSTHYNVFVHDRNTAATTLVSVDSAGNEGNDASCCGTSISSDGRYVVFESAASNLVANDTNGFSDVFVHDRHTATTTLVSVDSAGNQGFYSSWLVPGQGSISGDGRFIAFTSFSPNLVAGDSNAVKDVFVYDRNTATTTRASVDELGTQANNGSDGIKLSADGRYAVFATSASNLFAGDANERADVVISAMPRVTVASVVPTKLRKGATTSVTVTGTNFLTGAIPEISGALLSNIVVVDENTITMAVLVPADQPTGAKDVTVTLLGTGPGPSTGAIGTCTGCVTFSPPPGC